MKEEKGKDAMHSNPETCPTNPLDQPEADPLAMPGVVRLLLSVGASQALQQSGEECFQILAKCSYPATPGRWAVWLKPCPLEVATAATAPAHPGRKNNRRQ